MTGHLTKSRHTRDDNPTLGHRKLADHPGEQLLAGNDHLARGTIARRGEFHNHASTVGFVGNPSNPAAFMQLVDKPSDRAFFELQTLSQNSRRHRTNVE